ncbi:MAG: MarR family transcriptional regulator, partial [Candidatus Sericytochromatia bacterium]|nr:MarR family transcriptional regulator [Candidatus Sericytochromatia bacterium]
MPPAPEPHIPLSNDVSLLPVLRALVECHTQIGRVASRSIEAMDLTHSQFDVLATLGDTAGMTCKALGELTLITKGTLSPVLDRMA